MPDAGSFGSKSTLFGMQDADMFNSTSPLSSRRFVSCLSQWLMRVGVGPFDSAQDIDGEYYIDSAAGNAV